MSTQLHKDSVSIQYLLYLPELLKIWASLEVDEVIYLQVKISFNYTTLPNHEVETMYADLAFAPKWKQSTNNLTTWSTGLLLTEVHLIESVQEQSRTELPKKFNWWQQCRAKIKS